ncbi:hypothetical protein E2C01_102202 [Portunus trituberculatus]|uniref:Uncharacterized protein n=1 Tax=Portunus trituberculatus TaxID=210409 RepID=A0A5B7KCJ4_PORTR|nr:hypothetical protein [Portunus trituberculatus]
MGRYARVSLEAPTGPAWHRAAGERLKSPTDGKGRGGAARPHVTATSQQLSHGCDARGTKGRGSPLSFLLARHLLLPGAAHRSWSRSHHVTGAFT